MARNGIRMRTIFVVMSLLAFPVVAAGQPVDWQKYVVPETGANVDLPMTIFSKDAGQPESGYGRRFLTADGRANLTVQSTPNKANDSPAAYLAKMRPSSDIVYRRVTPNFFVLSSFRKDKIWYDRRNFAGRFMNCMLINYPQPRSANGTASSRGSVTP